MDFHQTSSQGALNLICYPTMEPPFLIRPAPLSRTWMDSFPDHFPYRCLPVNIANMHSWEILCPVAVRAHWRGGRQKSALEVQFEGCPRFAASHFGGGVLTFQVGYLFRTVPHCNLLVTGPLNAPKDGIAPLTAVIETDWAPYPFTMNWMFTRCGTAVEFKKGEPFCAFFPVPRGLLEATEPEMRDLDSNPRLQEDHAEWCRSRREFLERLAIHGTREQTEKWQKHYFRGLKPDGTEGTKQHETNLRLKPIVDRRQAVDGPSGSVAVR